MMVHLKSVPLTCTHINRYMFFHEITADLFDTKSTSLPQIIRGWFCGPHCSKRYVHIHVFPLWLSEYFEYISFEYILNVFQNTFHFVFGTCWCLIACEFFHSCAKEPGRAQQWLSTAELLVCVPVQLSEPFEDSILCFAAGGFNWEKPHIQHWWCLWVLCLASNRSVLDSWDGSPHPMTLGSMDPLRWPVICCVSLVRDHTQDVLLRAWNSCHP